MINLNDVWINDDNLSRCFNWLTRIGASYKFGSLPIGWYQNHQCAAIKYLEDNTCKGIVCMRKGYIVSKDISTGKWIRIITPRELFRIADNTIRK